MQKKKAIMFTSNKNDAKRVYSEHIMKLLNDRYDLYPTLLCKQNLSEHLTAAKEAEYLFSTWGIDPCTEEEIKSYFPNLKCVFYAAGSVQHFAHAFLNCGIRVFSAWQANAVPVAEYTHAQIQLALKGFFGAPLYAKTHYERLWETSEGCGGIYDAKVGLIGVGCIGKMVAEKLKQNDLEVLYYDPFLPKETAEALDIKPASLEEIFSQCRVVSNHLPNKDELTGILSGALFESMMPYSVFINTGRGRQVDEPGLVAAMQKDKTKAALLDVLIKEPLDPDCEIAKCENILVTPHIAGSLGREVIRMAKYMADEAKRIDKGEAPLYEVSLEMLKTMA